MAGEETIRQGDWEYRLQCRWGASSGEIGWFVFRSKVGADGDPDNKKYMESYGPYGTARQAKDAADWPESKTEVEELWEWGGKTVSQISQSLPFIANSHQNMDLWLGLVNALTAFESLRAKWKTQKK